MTKIKAKCWDKELKRFVIYEPHISIDLNGNVRNLQNGEGNDSYELVLYTGLSDKNGNEIYEGVITNQDYIIKWCDKCHGFQPFLNSKSLDECFSCNHNFNWFDVIEDENIEIIGNIYENPELVYD